MVNGIESGSKGEPPINWRIETFPSDASLVLKLRAASKRYRQQHKISSPVADLQAEQILLDTSPEFRRMHSMVRQPIAFALPTPVLRVLSLFTSYQYVNLP